MRPSVFVVGVKVVILVVKRVIVEVVEEGLGFVTSVVTKRVGRRERNQHRQEVHRHSLGLLQVRETTKNVERILVTSSDFLIFRMRFLV